MSCCKHLLSKGSLAQWKSQNHSGQRGGGLCKKHQLVSGPRAIAMLSVSLDLLLEHMNLGS